MKNYIVLRLSNKQDGGLAARVSEFETLEPSLKEFYRFCGLAVDSEHIIDTVMLVDAHGNEIDKKNFTHAAQEIAPAEQE